jgi:hypothetical protein
MLLCRLPTKVNFHGRGVLGRGQETTCLWSEGESEYEYYLFSKYQFAGAICGKMFKWFGVGNSGRPFHFVREFLFFCKEMERKKRLVVDLTFVTVGNLKGKERLQFLF